ncbi:MAG: glutamate racemase [Hyphomonadaceae bacterium]
MTIDSHPPENVTPRGRVLVFDSGIGGLTVAAEIAALGPQLAIDYAADTGFFPYGDKSDAALRARLPLVAKALVDIAKPDVFVIACNTASTLALNEVRAVLDIPVVGTVPAIKPAAALTKTGTIGLLATPGTIGRDYTAKLIADYASETRVISHGSIELVKLAEAAARGETVPASEIEAAQRPLFDAAGGEAIDIVVLACTHFPLIRDQLAAAAPRAVRYIDSGEAIARQTVRVLEETGGASGAGSNVFLTDALERHTGLASIFKRFGFSGVQAVPVPSASTLAG